MATELICHHVDATAVNVSRLAREEIDNRLARPYCRNVSLSFLEIVGIFSNLVF